ncbi:MBL fold metallo-hydrolase [Puniceibacterium sp. IMCC21224]|uniref:MBL fold metallo-hydrolase n=1 Tax=Puniceibacterium sp. IMCC21224 TaxID=1618204 RepID=UPI00064D7A58|nr:MBL fold metallo-hydrolase [Puniceibacterium sp. IMCC21224]KMK68643.1 putative Zn-dependent hydrolase of beta-lactamase fold [Puniceibacterium sp. IMCC21224]
MTQTRRHFLVTAAATAGTVTLLPFTASAAAHGGDVFETTAGEITVHPVAHASFVMETPAGVIYSDPVGDPAQYASLPPADLILVTHEHGDHYNAETLAALMGDSTVLITNPAVLDMLPEDLKARASAIGNGESSEFSGVGIDAIPAYNTTEGRTNFHPQGRDNGYVLSFDGFKVYISGDSEDIPEMRALEGIDLAFLCMNLPFTMDVAAAASAVADFKPSYVYPYHYRGRDGGTQDPAEFAALVGESVEVKMGDWYPDGSA